MVSLSVPPSLGKALHKNADLPLSALSTSLGALSAIRSKNPTGFYPAYTRLATWDTPNLQSAYKKVTKGLEDNKRSWENPKFFAHTGFMSSFGISPMIANYLKSKISHNPTLQGALTLAGMSQGLSSITTGVFLEKIMHNNKGKKPLEAYIQEAIATHVHEHYKPFMKTKRKERHTAQALQTLHKNIFDPHKIESCIEKALKNYKNQITPQLPKDKNKKTRWGLPRINLQNIITTSLSAGLLYLGRQGQDVDGRQIGNSVTQMAATGRFMTSLHQMFFEPIFVKPNRAFTKDFTSLKTGLLKSDLVTISILGVGKIMVDLYRKFGMVSPKTNELSFAGHLFSFGTAAIAGSFIDKILIPQMKKALDSEQTKTEEKSIQIKNILFDKLQNIKNIGTLTAKEIAKKIDTPYNKILPEAYYT